MAAPAPPRQFSIAKPTAASRQSGVLPAPGTANRTSAPQKDHNVKLKVIVRRLAPGLTREEFETAMGNEWKVGAGKVNWMSYHEGKIAKDSAKPSRPSRAYFNLVNSQFLGLLADKIKSTQFVDANGSHMDVALLGPPTLVYASYSKIPGKSKIDGRQGTIDQDLEFIDFLTSLTEPVIKPANIDQADKVKDDAKVITPLVQFIKDKKANKGKDAKKHGRQDSKDSQTKADPKQSSVKNGRGKAAIVDKKQPLAKNEKAARDVVGKAVAAANKMLKQNQTVQTPAATPAPPTPPVVPAAVSQPQTKPERRRERGNVSMAAKILQRDLGLAPAAGRRRGGNAITPAVPQNPMPAASAEMPITTPASSDAPAIPGPVTSPVDEPEKTTATPVISLPPPVQTPTGPAAQTRPRTPTVQSTQTSNANPQADAPAATQAFLKHANPSQGVTEPLLEEAFKVFGTVIKVEIDKRKGFAYLEFADPAALKNAIAASPVKVAQGSVVVLERKTGSTLQNRNARGPNYVVPPMNRGGRHNRGRGGRNNGNTPRPAAPAPVLPPAPITAPT